MYPGGAVASIGASVAIAGSAEYPYEFYRQIFINHSFRLGYLTNAAASYLYRVSPQCLTDVKSYLLLGDPAMEIWTDGSISPESALSTAAKIMIDHLRYIAGISEETLSVTLEKEILGSRLTSEVTEAPVESLDLSVRVFNSLKRTGITTVGDVLELLEKGENAVMSIRNFGEKSLDELRTKMREGLSKRRY
jgi:hypothetical protein